MKVKHSLFLLLAALLAPWAANAQDNNTIILNGNKDIVVQPGETYNFYDSGGPDGNYGSNETYILTLTCDSDITINFSQFETESGSSCSDWDYMRIYDGEFSGDNLLVRGQTDCPNSLVTGRDYVATSGTMIIIWNSDWNGVKAGWVATITGVCAPVVVNDNSVYTENFDSYTSHTNNASSPNTYPNDPLPQCWQFINRSDGSYPPYPKAFLTSNYAVSGNCLLLNSSGVKDLYAILPQFEGNISGYQLTFTYRNEGTTDDNGTLYVGYMTNPNDTTTFVQTLECPKRAALTTKAAFFLQAPQGSYIAFKYGDGAYDYDLYIDDVVVSVVPSCIPTGTPTCGELSAHTAKLSWDLVDATQTAWEVEYSTSIEFAGSLTVDATTHEDFELTGLVAETQYYARVRAKCGNDDYSAWSETITFTTFNTCPVPFNLAANNLTAGKADLSWTGSIDVPSYDVRHRKAYHVIGDYERFDTRPDGWDQKFQELDRVMNGEGWEEGEAYGRIPWMFGTQNGVFDSHAYLYDFGHSHQWLITDSYTVKSSDALNFDLALTGYNEFNTTDFLEPEITETNYRFIVLIIKDSDYNTNGCSEWEILREWNNTGSDYVFNNIAYSRLGEHVSIDLSGYVGQTVRIAFYGESDQYTDGNTLHIDNMAFGTPVAATPWEYIQDITANTATVMEVLRNLSAETEYEAQVKSNCSDAEAWCAPLFFTTLEAPDAPTGLQVVEGSITATGASFSWDGEANESFQYFTVTNPQEVFEPTEATVWTNVQGNTVNVTDAFTPNRVARFYLRKDCGDDGLSKYTYVEFRTGCGTVVIDDINSYTENFDSYTAGTSDAQAPSTYPNDPLPQCWQFLNRSATDYPQVFISTFQDYIVSGNCLFFKSSSTTPLYAILPEFAQPVANLQVTFTYRNEGTNIDNGTLHVGYMTDPSDASTFVSTLECRKTTTLTTMTAYFPHAPQQGRMTFMYKGGEGEPYYLSIDDVEVSVAPSCLHTGKPSCGELSSQTAKLSWDLIDATQTAWDVQYSTSQDFAEYSTVIADRHENFELCNLEPETQYYARVRARCSDEAFSAWSETITFTTFSTCPVPFNLAVSSHTITQVSAVLSWSGTIDVQSYDVRYKSTAASSWRTIQDITATTAVLSNLNACTEYEAQVKSNCSNPEAWSASVVFETDYAGSVPTGLQVSGITATDATFTWDADEYATSYQYCAVTNPQEGFDPTDWINVQGNTVRLENAFTPNRPARFYIRKYFGNQAVSNYAYVDFHTECGPMVLSFDGDNDFYFEDFEGYEGNSCIGNEFSGTLPRCWDGYFTSQYEQPEVIAGWAPHIINNGNEYCYYHHSGTNSLFFFGREYGYAALPYFDNPISTLRISFWMKRDAGGTLVLGYIKSGDVNYNTFTPIAEFEDSYFSMVQHSKDLNEVPAEATRLVFRWYSEGASYECCIDDVKVSLLPTCQPPTGLAVGNVTSTGATFTWEAEDDETFQYFTISNPTADFEPSRETNWTVVHGNTLNLTNVFAPNTLVRFYLRKVCGDGGYSDYTSVAFRTICDPISLVNYSEDFDSYTGVSSGSYPHDTYPFDPLPDCWRFLTRPEESYDNPQVFISSNSSYANSWDNCLFFRSSATTPIYAVLPEFEENISGYQLTFTYRNEATYDASGTLYVGYMTDPDDTSTFVQTLACPKTTAFTTTTAYFTDAPQGSYMAFKYAGGTHDNYFLSIDDVVVSEAPTCFPTGKPTHGELSAHTSKLSWDLVDPTQTAWEVQYSKNQDFSEATVVTATTHEDFQITGLDAETQYHVQVRAKCSETDFGTWSETLTLTTLSTCPVPTNLVASNITQESAKINWTGSIDVESYAVRYHKTDQVVGIDERFNTASLPEGWESKKGLLSDIVAGGAFGPSDQRSWTFGANGYGFSEMSAYLVVNGTDHNDWLITKRHTVTSSDAFSFDLSISSTNPNSSQITNGPDDRFVVLITADDGRTWNILREWNNSGSEYVYINISPYEFQQESIDLSGYVGQTVRIAFYGESTESNASNCLHLDNVVFGTPMAASETQTQTGITGNQESAANSFVIQGLVANTEYEVQVKSECSNPEVWSAPITFRTLDPYMKVFVGGDISGADEWNNSNNWVPAGVPTINQGVELQANATIRSGYVAEANQIEGDYGLTIEDGGQLKTNNTARAMVKKVITGYGAGNEADKAGYYLIANPLDANIMSSALTSTNMLTGNYDLYNWDNSQEVEWRNYEENSFDMASGLYGYLYANEATTELSFMGSVRSNVNANLSRNVYDYSDQYEFGGWWLLGNPYVCNAYLSSASANGTALPYIKMNGDGDGFTNVAAGTPIEPMEGFFYQTDATKDVYVVITAPAVQSGSKLNMNLRRNNKQLDNAILVFGGDQQLGKMTFRANSSKIFLPVEGKDYAITSVEGQVGEVPVSFVPEKNGTYSLSFTSEEVSFSYLHLIDNMTGNDVNLLETPSYTFDARTTDYASRFKLVFAVGSSATDDTFGFVNGSGNFCIFGIEGEATVQVIDVLGHVLSSEQFSGSYERHLNVAPGVYMIRLIQGNDVKVQKVVVRR